jgi:HEPN domain-containing protein
MPTLNEVIEWWTKQAAHDLEMAKSNRQNGFHDGCALMCQQSAEKYLKALYIMRHQETPPKIHQCDKLAKMLAAPNAVIDAGRDLEADYTESRYPDAAEGVPFERFNDGTSEQHLAACQGVQQWVLQQLTSAPPSSGDSPTPSSGSS